MQHPAWFLFVIGVVIAGIGVVWLLASSIPWLGKQLVITTSLGEEYVFRGSINKAHRLIEWAKFAVKTGGGGQ